MSLFSRCFMFSVLALAMMFAMGCVDTSNGRIFASPAWEGAHGAAGKVLLIVSGSPKDRAASYHVAEVTQIASGVLQQLPNTTVLPVKTPTGWSSDPDDAQAIAQAQTQGADTVCVLSIARYYGIFWIGFNPLPQWNGNTHVLYSLRLIDVHTGDMLAHAITSSESGGSFQIRTHNDLKHDLERALRNDLTPPAKAAT
jgi:hypothetical protein